MGFEEIDESYRREVEKADKEFIDAIKSKANLKESEVTYSRKLRAAREKYNRLIGKNIKSIKDARKKSKSSKPMTTAPFKVNLERYNLTRFQKFKYNFGLIKFKSRISLRNFRENVTPRIVFYHFLVLKFKLRRIYKRITGKIESFIGALENSFVKSREGFKELSKKSYEKISALPELIMTKLKNLKGKKKEGEGKEEKKEVSGDKEEKKEE